MTRRVLFVCLGNICRSPAAEGVLRRLVSSVGPSYSSAPAMEIESAGTGDWHAGERPDQRMRDAARRRGIELQSRARQVQPNDFRHFDRIIAMDRSNLEELEMLLRKAHPQDDGELKARLRLLSDYRQASEPVDVPDPYYGGPEGFEVVLDLLEDAAPSILEDLLEE